jgi:hypothetical protein
MAKWLLAGGEIAAGVAFFVGLVMLVTFLRPPHGSLQERAVVKFPGAWIVVGLPLTFAFGTSIALVAIGLGILR